MTRSGDQERKHNASRNRNNVVNLTGFKLLPTALSLLEKGLSFIPSPQFDGPNCNMYKDLRNGLQTLKGRHIDRYAGELPNRACRMLQCCLKSIPYDFGNISIERLRANMSGTE